MQSEHKQQKSSENKVNSVDGTLVLDDRKQIEAHKQVRFLQVKKTRKPTNQKTTKITTTKTTTTKIKNQKKDQSGGLCSLVLSVKKRIIFKLTSAEESTQ